MRMIDRLGSFDPCATPSANDRYLRTAAGWSRRKAAVADRGLGRLNWAESAPTGVGAERTGVGAKAAIPLRGRNGRHSKAEPCAGVPKWDAREMKAKRGRPNTLHESSST
jgi:hypothetical protein